MIRSSPAFRISPVPSLELIKDSSEAELFGFNIDFYKV